MCGLAGILVRPNTLSPADLEQALERMIAPLVHRGPDDKGTWGDPARGVGLGFRRLAILDLSEAGHQPMRSGSGRFTMVFNGEIYNFLNLARELEAGGARFRGHSDSEVILAAFERWGVESAVRRFVGMFAIAVWDAHENRLSLVRDQLGIKPLYIYAKSGIVSFGSELKALRAGPEFDETIDLDALTSYLRYMYVPAPLSIFRHAVKLRPGHILHIDDPARPLPESTPYWSAEDAARRGLADPFQGSDTDAIDELERLLKDAVTLQMQSDVPLGALLSGGVDSSLVVALMQAASNRPVETFSIGFDQPEFNEAPFAASVAKQIGTRHTQLIVTDADALHVVPRLAEMFDEPFADSSQIPTFLVCQLARRQVTVALSGDGGDELFAGYQRYMHGQRLLRWIGGAPRSARRALAGAISSVSPTGWDRLARTVGPVLPGSLRVRPGDKMHRLSGLLNTGETMTMYRSLVSGWQDPSAAVNGGIELRGRFEELLDAPDVGGTVDHMMLADQAVYLPDDLLAKTDRTSMAVSLEVRVPLLDHRLVELAWRMPMSMKVRQGRGKWLLRQVLYRHVPMALVDRPKMGFQVPIDAWLRGGLRSWADDLLSPKRLAGGELHATTVRRMWTDFQAGRGNTAPALWAVLMYQAWKERWGSP